MPRDPCQFRLSALFVPSVLCLMPPLRPKTFLFGHAPSQFLPEAYYGQQEKVFIITKDVFFWGRQSAAVMVFFHDPPPPRGYSLIRPPVVANIGVYILAGCVFSEYFKDTLVGFLRLGGFHNHRDSCRADADFRFTCKYSQQTGQPVPSLPLYLRCRMVWLCILRFVIEAALGCSLYAMP